MLLIVGLVPDDDLRSFISLARELGIAALVEIHGEEELGRALSAGAELVGVNNRNLVTLEVETATAKRAAALFPEGLRTVSESGIKDPYKLGRLDLGLCFILAQIKLAVAHRMHRIVASINQLHIKTVLSNGNCVFV